MKNKIFAYLGNEITFNVDDSIMANATEMAKPFGKKAADFLKTKNTQDFIQALSASKNIEARNLVKIVNGGRYFGTWMHEDVALEFARWLSPVFAIWCNDRIKELLTNGHTEIKEFPIPQTYSEALLLAAHQAEQIELQEKQLKIQAPKAEYYDKVLDSKGVYVTNQIAKELGMSAVTLNRQLHMMGIQYKQNGTWVLYHQYQNKGLTKTRTYTYQDGNGETKTSMQTVWTEKGREFIHNASQKHAV